MDYFGALGIVAQIVGGTVGVFLFLFFPVMIQDYMLSTTKFSSSQAEMWRVFGHVIQVLIGIFVVLPYTIVWLTNI